MGKLFSIFILTGFMLISAFANFGNSYAFAGTGDQSGINLPAITDEDRCPCEEDSDSTKFVCGVTLALINQPHVEQPQNPGASRVVLYDTTCPKNIVSLLKRPPRPSI